MQCVAFYTIVRSGDPGVGVVRRADPDFMSAGKAQTESKTVFKLEGAAPVSYTHLTLPTIYSV